ncbi:AAA family ATPase [Micromonospora sp. NBRC 101691]|uniref:AAA family ATPase n=1 Tax=Micromonospora sp. NBRC 101691 TaxID=3032198 RepID=UPI0024A2D3DE|nr:AAA family ATPase [Micromonospora sp. NBRC 101691]GLY24435.1 hypothetical protein Misp04_41670 [Micromonospora sp. NBRC 101691]
MARRRTPPKKQTPPAPRPRTRPATGPADLVEEAADAAAKAKAVLPDSVPLSEPAATPETGVDESTLRSAYERYAQAQQAYELALRELDKRGAAVAAAEAEVARRADEIDERDAVQDAREMDLRRRDDEAAQLRVKLDERDSELLAGEMRLVERQEREKEEILASARVALAATLERVEAERRALDEERERGREQLRAELDDQRRQLHEERVRLQKERRELRDLKRELDLRQEDLDDLKELYDERLENAAEAATESLRLQYKHLEERHSAAREQLDRLEEQAAELERLRRAFGHREPRDVLESLATLERENTALRQSQRSFPEDAMARLTALQEEKLHWAEEHAVLVAENASLQRRLGAYESNAVELERMKVTKEAAEATVRAYQATVEDLRKDMEGLIERREGAAPFPACTKMDSTYGTPPEELLDEVPPLPELISRIRAYIAQQHRIYYSERDLRCFLAGLATSQLHLLQGISGIGKTQLPQRFAEAIGAASSIVSVGADWRTPQDLMGYYNAFERKFYESEFTQALYQAQCPEFGRQPFFVVLDEMNLSYPEQYFNDVLSAMELTQRRGAAPPSLVLMSAGVEPAPALLREGRKLLLPGNVWFVGTANHDETTVSFADKTYDRAHVLELPAEHQSFKPQPVEPLGAISTAALKRSFTAARRQHGKRVDDVREFLDGALAPRMLSEFRISWGSRVRRQLGSYVSVVLASGGSITEAVDHVVATKVLRKLRGRHEVRAQKLDNLRNELTAMWHLLDPDEPPTYSIRLLDEEIYLRGDV